MFIFLSKNKEYMLTVQDIKNKKIKGAWKGKIEKPKSESIINDKLHLNLCDAIKDKNFDQIEKILIVGGRLTQEDKKFISEVMKTYTPEEEARFEALYSKKYN